MLNDIDAVIFDMDGTIIDSMWVWKRVDEDFLRSRNIDMPYNIQKQIEGLSFTDTAKYFKAKFSLEEDIEDIKTEWLYMVKHYYENVIPLKEGAYEFICRLKQDGKKIGLATANSRDLAEIILKRTELYDFFDTIVTCCEVERDKSFPDIFLKVANHLEVYPSRCLVFEDTLASMKGAKMAGMRVVAVYDEYSLPYKDEIINYADKYINKFEEIA